MQFVDAGGDDVRTYMGAYTGKYMIECSSERGEYLPLALTPSMARALAVDLLAFADSAEQTQEDAS